MRIATGQLVEGYELPTLSRGLRLERLQDFSGHLGDSFCISDDAAQRWGFPKAIAQGLQVYSLMLGHFIDLFGEDWFNGSRLYMKFIRPAYEGKTIAFQATVQRIDRSEGKRVLFFDVRGYLDSELAVVGEAEMPCETSGTVSE